VCKRALSCIDPILRMVYSGEQALKLCVRVLPLGRTGRRPGSFLRRTSLHRSIQLVHRCPDVIPGRVQIAKHPFKLGIGNRPFYCHRWCDGPVAVVRIRIVMNTIP
jgi:hypothetical protein